MRVITLDTNKVVIGVKNVGDTCVLGPNDIVTNLGEIGQIQQADGTFSAPVIPQPTLEDVKVTKSAQLQEAYNNALAAGFNSSATGTVYTFGYGPTDREKFMQLTISVLSGVATFPVPIPAKDNTIVMHDQTQYQQLLADINKFAWEQQNKLHTLLAQVQAAQTVDEVNAITW